MNDHAQRLRAAIAELERELQHLEETDPETRTLLKSAAQEISEALSRPRTEPADDVPEVSTSKSLLEEKVLEFEVSHPKLSLALNRLIDMLGQIGI